LPYKKGQTKHRLKQCLGSGFNESGSGSRVLLNPDLIGIRIQSQIKVLIKKLEKLTIEIKEKFLSRTIIQRMFRLFKYKISLFLPLIVRKSWPV
jgi:hypothetical protein